MRPCVGRIPVECYDKRFVRARQQRALRVFDLAEVGRVSLATGLFDFVESFADVDRHEIWRHVSS